MARTRAPDRHRDEPRTVLIVEDQEPTRMLIKAAVEGTEIDCRILEAADGDAALAAASRRRPDLVLLDIVLAGSGTSGVLVCHQLCKDPRTKVVIISGQSSAAIVQTCLNAGATAYLPKPFSLDALQVKVKGWLTS